MHLAQPAKITSFAVCIDIGNQDNKTAYVSHKSQKAYVAIFGYARVSTDGQTLASQDAELMAAGCAKVYQEKVSGARTDRAELGKLLKRIEAVTY